MGELSTRGDLLRYAIAFALSGASKVVRGLRHAITEEERYRVADDVVRRLQDRGDPWCLREEPRSAWQGTFDAFEL